MRAKKATNPDLSVEVLLADPIIQLVMMADRVDATELRAMLEALSRERTVVAFPQNLSDAADANNGYRKGVGIILLNKGRQVLVGRRIGDETGLWQMPQGGIEPGESPAEAALRELREEIGTDNVELLAESQSWFRYDLPSAFHKNGRSGRWRGQRQKWLVMRFLGDDSEIDIATEHPEFAAWRWVEPGTATSLVINFKRDLYQQVLLEFAEAVSPA